MGDRIYLEDIINKKKMRIKQKQFNSHRLLQKISKTGDRPSFYDAIGKKGLSIIGEIKKASPSKGLIKKNFNPLVLSSIYDNCVDAISVLTEEDYFLGRDSYLKHVSDNVKIPTLCKDFIIDINQIYNAKVLGASCILLIVAVLDQEKLNEFITVAHGLSMDALVEVHTKEEIDRAVKAGAKIIGINNRDLKTFKTDINNTLKLRKHIPEDILTISESGINRLEYLKNLKDAHIDGILVGESFMRCDNIKKLSKEMRLFYDS
ncbi:indole-3-glycerol phosphate synthase [Vallitalea longa]|uniref:Indole-3-glycerol phosphate synthase n=1 Tax=Vallitalea longa TaxID=2936439 RepID=A0A9W5Y8W5_9FIRM|nr:indole-3-glycerol phosphate synthase TrpC [Vallitalea longa]GKX29392.1 indole-3-glycerol phosphate synthase [Vallitalea longa]